MLLITCITITIGVVAAIRGTSLSWAAAPVYDNSKIYDTAEINKYLKQSDGKLAFWTNADKSTADIGITYKQEVTDIYYLATLCSAHELSEEKLSAEITGAASVANVRLQLEGMEMMGPKYANGDPFIGYASTEARRPNSRRTVQKASTTVMKGDTFDLSTAHLVNEAPEATIAAGSYVRTARDEDRTAEITAPYSNVSSNPDTVVNLQSSGEHANVIRFAHDIIEAFQGGYHPDVIVLSFDPYAWAVCTKELEEPDAAETMRQAAEILAPYYENNKVIWLVSDNMLTDGDNKRIKSTAELGYTIDSLAPNVNSLEESNGYYREYDTPSYIKFVYPHAVGTRTALQDFATPSANTTFFDANNPKAHSFYKVFEENYEPGNAYSAYSHVTGTNINSRYAHVKSEFIQYCFEQDERVYHSAVHPTEYCPTERPIGSYSDLYNIVGVDEYMSQFTVSKKMPFYQYALLDPQKYLEVTDESGQPTQIPDIDDWQRNVPTYGYADAESASQSIQNHMQIYNKYIINDKLDSNLTYDSAEVAYYDDGADTWVTIADGVSISHSNRQVTATITNPVAIGKRVRLLIHTKSPKTFHTGDDSNRSERNTNDGKARVQTYFDDTPSLAKEYDSPKLLKDPKITLTKTATPTAIPNATTDSKVTWTFEVTNNGDIPLRKVTISDPTLQAANRNLDIRFPNGSTTLDTLAVGASVTATASFANDPTVTAIPITQADINAGSIENTATVTAAYATGDDLIYDTSDDLKVTATDDATVVLSSTPGISIQKTVSVQDKPNKEKANIGDVLVYEIVVTNTGGVTLTNVCVTDEMFNITNPVAATLTPGAQVTLNPAPTHTVTVEDARNKKVDNTATVVGTTPSGGTVTDEDVATKDVVANPQLQITKSVTSENPVQKAVADQSQVTWKIVITNAGDVPITNLTLSDPVLAAHECDSNWILSDEEKTLGVGDSITKTVKMKLKQADIDAGTCTNVASVQGTSGVDSSVVVGPVQDSDSVVIIRSPNLSIDKSVEPSSGTTGSTVKYTIKVENKGNVTLSAASLTDATLGIDVPLSGGTLAPGEIITLTSDDDSRLSHVITEQEVLAGSLSNTAQAHGTPPDGSPLEPTDTAIVTLSSNPALKITKTTEEVETISNPKVGDNVTWKFEVENTGNVTLHDIAVIDALVAARNPQGITLDATTLAPSAKAYGTTTTPLTQDDIDAGKLENVAQATGKTPSNQPVSSNESTAEVTLTQNPVLKITKTTPVATLENPKAGDNVTWDFEVENMGNVTIRNLTIVDELMSGRGTITLNKTTLMPGEKAQAQTNMSLLQTEIDAGTVTNIAMAQGRGPSDQQVSSPQDDATVVLTRKAALDLVKEAHVPKAAVGDQHVAFTITATNTGNVTLTNVTINDELTNDQNTPVTPSVLAPGQSGTATVTYGPVTDQDAINRKIHNVATGHGTPPDGVVWPGDPSAEATVSVVSEHSMMLEKTVNPAEIAEAHVGDKVKWSVKVTNTGQVAIENVRITDKLLEERGLNITLSKTSLRAGESATGTAEMAVTQLDIDAGKIVNVAVAHADNSIDESASLESNPAVAEVVLGRKADFSVTKVADCERAKEGDRIQWRVAVKNTGNVTLRNLVFDDELLGIKGRLLVDSLDPGKSAEVVLPYVVTKDDVVAKSVLNVASVHASPPDGMNELGERKAQATVAVERVSAPADPPKAQTPTRFANMANDLVQAGGDAIVVIALAAVVVTGSMFVIIRKLRRP